MHWEPSLSASPEVLSLLATQSCRELSVKTVLQHLQHLRNLGSSSVMELFNSLSDFSLGDGQPHPKVPKPNRVQEILKVFLPPPSKSTAPCPHQRRCKQKATYMKCPTENILTPTEDNNSQKERHVAVVQLQSVKLHGKVKLWFQHLTKRFPETFEELPRHENLSIRDQGAIFVHQRRHHQDQDFNYSIFQ